MENIMLDKVHSVAMTRWLLRAINNPILNSYILDKSHVFSVFFVLLNDNVKWTKAVNDLINETINEEYNSIFSEKYKEFSKRLLMIALI